MKIGSHNSMSYLPPKKWYLWPFKLMAKCQSKSLEEQYEKYGIRVFDFRISYSNTGEPCFRHGLMQYKGNVEYYLDFLNKKGDAEVRIILEEYRDDKTLNQEVFFKRDCIKWKRKYNNIKFFEGRRKWDWKIIHDFKYKGPKYIQLCASMVDPKWDDAFPFIYAKYYNRVNIEKYKDFDGTILIDYVHIQ